MLFFFLKIILILILDGKKSEVWIGIRWYMDVWKIEWMIEWKNVDIYELFWLRCWIWCFFWVVFDVVYLVIDLY